MFGSIKKKFNGIFSIYHKIPLGSQMLGGTKDVGGCYTGAGYEWCPTDKCVRLWITPCKVKTEYCPDSPMQLCRMTCPPAHCSKDECAISI